MLGAARRTLLIASLGIALGGSAGCSLFRTPEAKVSGNVSLDFEPIGDAEILFVRDDPEKQNPIVARSDSAGRYHVVGNTGKGIPPGRYKVAVTKMALPDKTVPRGEKVLEARENGELQNILPKAYADVATTPLVFDIKQGPTTLNLELKSQP